MEEAVRRLNKKVNYIILFLGFSYIISFSVVIAWQLMSKENNSRFEYIDKQIRGVKSNQQVIMGNQRIFQDTLNRAIWVLRNSK